MATPKQDNSTLRQKIALRRKAGDLLHDEWGLDEPTVMETHGGEGVLFNACYAHLQDGVVFEQDEQKVNLLARQRPGWSVYQADCEAALAVGAGGHMAINLLDCDPYGMPWATLKAFFSSPRAFAARMVVVVNDGTRIKLATGSGWEVEILQPVVRKYGNDLHPIYLEVCREMMDIVIDGTGYKVNSFAGYYCGHSLANTHYMVTLSSEGE